MQIANLITGINVRSCCDQYFYYRGFTISSSDMQRRLSFLYKYSDVLHTDHMYVHLPTIVMALISAPDFSNVSTA